MTAIKITRASALGVVVLLSLAACETPPSGAGPSGSAVRERPASIGTLERSGPHVHVDGRHGVQGEVLRNGAYLKTGAASQARIRINSGGSVTLDENTDPAFWEEWISATRCLIRYVISSGSIGGDTGDCQHAVTDPDGNEFLSGSQYVISRSASTTVFTLLSGRAWLRKPRRESIRPGYQVIIHNGFVYPQQRLSPEEVRRLRQWLNGFDFSRTRPRIRLVTVPPIEGLDRGAAQRRLRAAQLALGRVEEKIVRGRRPGTVVSQLPLPGVRVPPGTALIATIAADGPPPPPPAPTRAVPDLRGRTVDQAAKMLDAVGFILGNTERELIAGAREGIVVRQSIRPGTRQAPGIRVGVVVAEAGVEVPNVVGATLERARVVLQRAGLALGGVREVTDRRRPAGTILQQEHRPGVVLRRGQDVPVVVSRRPVATTCIVPPILSRNIEEAKRILAEAGMLGRVTRTYPYARERVTGVTPPPGTRINCKQVIEIQLGVIG